MRDLSLLELLGLLRGVFVGNRFLAVAPRYSRDEMQAWQLTRIRRLVAHAYERSAFYRSLYGEASFEPGDLRSWDDFHRLPIVTKDQVIANFPTRILASGYDLDRLVVSRSSGSSGKVLDIAYDSRAMVTYVLAGLRLYRMGFNYRPWHRQLYVYTSPYPLSSLFGLYPLVFIPTLAPVPQIVEAIKTRSPDLLVCYPSHLKQVEQSLTERDLEEIHLKAISVNSEMSTQAERDYLASRFRCPVLDEYSSEELTRIAGQCRHHTYHVFEDINYVEVLREGGSGVGGVFPIVGTNLHNFAMPMIRYLQNDLGDVAEGECPCGWRFRKLVHLQGRRNDSFMLPSGKILSSGFLLDATYEFLLNHRTAIRDFCLIQEAREAVTLQVVAGEGWNALVQRQIEKRFVEFLEPGMRFAVAEVSECEKTKTGKRNPIISRLSRSG